MDEYRENKMDKKTFIEELSEMKEKAEKYEHLRQRHEDMIKKLTTLFDEIQTLLTASEPLLNGARHRKERVNLSDVIDYINQQLKLGQYISLKVLTKEFPNKTEQQLKGIMYRLPKMNNKIHKRKVNGESQYYL